jgi:DNA-binding transcriptional ArsR family regulator
MENQEKINCNANEEERVLILIRLSSIPVTLDLDFKGKKVEIICPTTRKRDKMKFGDVEWWLKDSLLKKFATKLAQLTKQTTISSDELRDIKMEIDKKYEEWKKKLSTQKEEKEEEVEVLNEEEKKILDELISGKTPPIPIIQKALDKEIVDEEVNKSVVFFAGMSSKLKNYRERLHCRLVGPSSAGKTKILTGVLNLFPSSMKIEISGMTPKAWIYQNQEGVIDFTGKILICIVEPPSSFYELINSVLTGDRKKFSWLYTDKDENGKLTASQIEAVGVPVYLTSSVRLPNEELATRVLQLSPDTSPRQTKAILDFMAQKEYVPDSNGVDYAKIVRSYIKTLPICEVVAPFFESVINSFPLEVRMRRDYFKLLVLVKAIALTCYYQRQKVKTKDGEVLLASFEDFYLGLRLFYEVFEPTFTGVPTYLKKFLKELKEREKDLPSIFSSLQPQTPVTFTTEDVIKLFTSIYSPQTLRRYLKMLEKLGVVDAVKIGGKKNYKIIATLDDALKLKFNFGNFEMVRKELIKKLIAKADPTQPQNIEEMVEKVYGDEEIEKFEKMWEQLNATPKAEEKAENVCDEDISLVNAFEEEVKTQEEKAVDDDVSLVKIYEEEFKKEVKDE